MALHGLRTLGEQRQPLSCFDGLRTDARKSAARMWSLEFQAAVHLSELASARSYMARFKESVEVAHRHVADTQSVGFTCCGR